MKKINIIFTTCLFIAFLATSVSAFKPPTISVPKKDSKSKTTQDTPVKSDKLIINKSSRIGKNVVKFAVTGAIVGAGVAALSGDKKDVKKNALKGALGGAAAGTIAGYIYGNIEAKTMRSRDQAVAKYKYTKDKGTFIKIETIKADPDAIAKGKQMAFETTYTVLTPSEKDKITVHMGFGVVLASLSEKDDSYTPGQLQEFQIENGGGTFKVTVPLKDSSKYEPQSYQFIIGIEANGKDKKVYESKTAGFNIMPATAVIDNTNVLHARTEMPMSGAVN